MNKFIVAAVAAAGLSLSASAALAHGHLVTGPELYATPATSEPVPAPESTAPAHKTRILRHTAHVPRANTAS
ncbi:hypothetical protein LMIY3S_04814 [Labrys miyagiensis]